MKNPFVVPQLVVLSLALAAGLAAALADENNGQQAGVTGSETAQAPKSGDPAAKEALGGHTVMIQTALASAQEQVNGIAGQYDVKQPPASENIDNIKTLQKGLKDSIKMAQEHQQMLDKSVQKFPDVASSEQYRSERTALNDVQTLTKAWSDKAKNSNYWKDQDQVRSDLDKLESGIDGAVSKTKSLSSGKLDLNVG